MTFYGHLKAVKKITFSISPEPLNNFKLGTKYPFGKED